MDFNNSPMATKGPADERRQEDEEEDRDGAIDSERIELIRSKRLTKSSHADEVLCWFVRRCVRPASVSFLLPLSFCLCHSLLVCGVHREACASPVVRVDSGPPASTLVGPLRPFLSSLTHSAMSAAAPIPAKAQAMSIPTRIKNPSTGAYIPLSSTPGGSLYGTTPGGTRIQYDRSSLLNYRNSPLSKSPAHLPQSIINLGVTTEAAEAIPEEVMKPSASAAKSSAEIARGIKDDQDEDLFEME